MMLEKMDTILTDDRNLRIITANNEQAALFLVQIL
jgi:hypothetical protein